MSSDSRSASPRNPSSPGGREQPRGVYEMGFNGGGCYPTEAHHMGVGALSEGFMYSQLGYFSPPPPQKKKNQKKTSL